MSSVGRLLDGFGADGARTFRVLGASGQLGYGIPTLALEEGLRRAPHMIGCDMGSIDIGPFYLGSGEMAPTRHGARRDLRKVLHAALEARIPLVIGSAGSAGARPHLETTVALIRDIAKADGLRFRLATISADIPRERLIAALQSGCISPLDGMPQLTENTIREATHVVGQMGFEAFQRAAEHRPDVIVAGRACDTGIFSTLPVMLGFPRGLSTHMAKIVECASLCCVPGGRDTILATLDDHQFTLESMAPERAATPTSVAAHSLYEQADPYIITDPDGHVDLREACYEAVDAKRTRVSGARWVEAETTTIKLEGATQVGHRVLLLAAAADPVFIAKREEILASIQSVVRDLVCDDDTPPDYLLTFRVYGIDGVRSPVSPPQVLPGEAFILGECMAPSAERAADVMRTTKQYLLHLGYAGRLSTAGNLAFPFTPPEVDAGPAYRFSIYHLMGVEDPVALFPVTIETL